MKIIFVALICLSTCTFGQSIVPDTSFSIYSTYQKERKRRPYIRIAEAKTTGDFKIKKNIVFASTPTGDLFLDIVYPQKKSNKPLPAVLFVFGGGWRSGNRAQNIPLAQKLAEAGYVCVTADYRLSTHALYPAAVYDLKNTVRWMKDNAIKFRIDTTKIAITGFSAGGQLAALVGTTNSDPKFDQQKINEKTSTVQAVIDVDGVLAFDHPESSEVSTDPNKKSVAAIWLGANLNDNPGLWHDASALQHAGKNSVPFLFINSSTPRFHAGRTEFIEKVKPFGIYTEVHEIADTPHPFWLFHPWFNEVADTMIHFLNQQFKSG